MRLALLAALAFIVFPARADIGEGSWEMETSTSIPGTAVGTTTSKQTQCLSAEDARDPSKLFGSPGAGCQFSNRRDDGSSYRFEISCSGAAAMNGSGEMRYSRDALEGEIVVRVASGGQTMETRSRIKARRLGPCR